MKKILCILFCLLLSLQSVSAAVTTGITCNSTCYMNQSVNNTTGVNISRYNISNSSQYNNSTNNTNNTTRHNYSSREYNGIRSWIIAQLPLTDFWDTHPLAKKDGFLYFNYPNKGMGALICLLLSNQDVLPSDWTWNRENIYELIKPCLHVNSWNKLDWWMRGDIDHWTHNKLINMPDWKNIGKTGKQFREGILDYYNYKSKYIYNHLPWEKDGDSVCLFDTHREYLISAVGQTVSWMMTYNFQQEYYSVEYVRNLILAVFDDSNIRDRNATKKFDFGWDV